MKQYRVEMIMNLQTRTGTSLAQVYSHIPPLIQILFCRVEIGRINGNYFCQSCLCKTWLCNFVDRNHPSEGSVYKLKTVGRELYPQVHFKLGPSARIQSASRHHQCLVGLQMEPHLTAKVGYVTSSLSGVVVSEYVPSRVVQQWLLTSVGYVLLYKIYGNIYFKAQLSLC